ncbi:cobalt transporter, partial [Geitlerinema sp. P-1104]
MNTTSMIGSLFALSLVFGAPTLTIAHVGHGDEFQAEGGIDRVPVNTDTDALLGIEVTPIAPAADGSSRILVPMTALVDADGNQLAFVQYENFYEPVPVQIGATEGELVEVTEGLSIGEQLVTQGSLSLYAESRKTQTADAATSSET